MSAKNGKSAISRRNVGIMAHIDAGKTTVTERVLYYAGKIRKTGEVHDGAATMDFMDEERKRGITIQSAATSVTWNGTEVNILDTPGHVDFTAEVERSLRVLDGAVAVFCGVAGVQAQSETVWRQASRYGVPRIAFVNKLDRTGANFERTVEMIRDRLGVTPLKVQVPLGLEADFKGVLDLVSERAFLFEQQEDGSTYTEIPVPEEERERLEDERHQLIDAVSHFSDEVLELYVGDEAIPAEPLARAIRTATLSLKATPVLCGSALKNKGVQLLLDAIVDYLPSPEEMPALMGVNPRTGEEVPVLANPDAPVAALAFKTVADLNGDLTFIRVYSGTLVKGMQLLNPRTGKRVRIGRLLKIHAKSREPIDCAHAGAIIAALGVQDTATGDSLCDRDHPVALSQMTFPDPVISMSVEPTSRTDRDRLSDSLGRLSREDPTFKVFTDQETGELIIGGMGELHLEVIRSRLLGEFKVETQSGAPQVAYRQALRRDIQVEGRHVKQSGGRGQFAVVKMRFSRGESDRDVEYESQVVGGSVPKEYHRAVGQGVQDIAETGAELRFPFVNVHAVLYDGKHHEVDSSEMAFREAGRIAMRQAIQKAGAQILEPRMRFTVEVPQDYLGDVLSDLQSRRADVQSLFAENVIKEIRGLIPVAELFSYSTTLRSLTQGRGTFHTEHANYAPVPEMLARQVVRETLARRGTNAGKAGRAAG